MRQNLLLFVFIFYSFQVFSQGKTKEEWFNEPYRPQFHFTPVENRMGCPISVVTIDSIYTLFYQWNPHNLQEGFVNWGCATSKDLLKWQHNPIALSQPIGITDSMIQTPWWGSVTQTEKGPFAYSNVWSQGIYRYSGYANGKWINNEKISGADEFTTADPYVFRDEKIGKWIMIAYNRGDSTMNILNSPDGLAWNKTTSFKFKYGFASLTELPVDRKPDDTRWLFITESGNYMLGKFNGETFELLTPLKKFDYGKQVGGTILFSDITKERTLMMSELKSEQHADLPSNGQLTFPTEVTLSETATGIELFRKPADEIKLLHKKSFEWSDKKIYPGINNNLLQTLKGDCFHVKGRIDLMNCDLFGFILRKNKDDEGVELNYNVSRGFVELEGNKISYRPENNKVEFEILIDRSSVELFIDKGRYVISTSINPDPKGLKYLIYTIGGEIMVEHLEIHELKSVWK